jgi:hypothetical protein
MDENSQALLEAARDLAASPPLGFWFSICDAGLAKPVDRQQIIRANGGLAALSDQAGTVCDLNAYALLCAAVGVAAVEELKTNSYTVEGPSPRLVDGAKTEHGHAHVFGPNQGQELTKTFRAWSRGHNGGICQIKVISDAGAHTFVFHRSGADAMRLFQAYEGGYRLADFLSLVKSNYLSAKKAHEFDYATFAGMRDEWGNYQCRSYIEVALNMIGNLALSLNGKQSLTPALYGKMFGMKRKYEAKVAKVGMLAFDNLASAKEIRANTKAIIEDKLVGMNNWSDIG